MVVKRGQLIASRESVCKNTGLTPREYRTAIKRLSDCNAISVKTTNRFTLVTICKYESYQQKDEPCDQPKTNKRPTNDQPKTNERPHLKNIRIEEDKEEHSLTNVRECKKSVALATPHSQALLEKRTKEFYDSLVPFVQFYGKELIREFFDYWSEPNKSRTKMRMELERTWCVDRRLATWAKREGEYGKRTNQTSNGSKSTKAERDAEFFRHVQEELAKPDEEPTLLPWEV